MLDQLAAGRAVIARSDGSHHRPFPVAISTEEGAALSIWVRTEGARNTIEIGLGYGIATLFICQGLLASPHLRELAHTAIDPFQRERFADVGLQLLNDAGVAEIVTHRPERSELALPSLLAAGARFDVAFIDGNHRFDAVFVDLFYLGRLLNPGAIVFLDDYQLPSIQRAASFFVNNLGWKLEQTAKSPNHHWAVLRTSSAPDVRPFWHFAEF